MEASTGGRCPPPPCLLHQKQQQQYSHDSSYLHHHHHNSQQLSGGGGSGSLSSSRRSSFAASASVNKRMSGANPNLQILINNNNNNLSNNNYQNHHNNNNDGLLTKSKSSSTNKSDDHPVHLPNSTTSILSSSSPTSITEVSSRHPLSCSMCGDKYKNPKVLPCLHTFCESCLIDYLPQDSLTLTCPECGQQSILPEKGIPALQTNFCVSSLSMEEDHSSNTKNGEENEEEEGTKKKMSKDGCAFCKKEGVRFKCHDCDDTLMCEQCSSKHQKEKFHKVSSLPPPQPRVNGHHPPPPTEEDKAQKRYLYCPGHAGQTLRFFCRDCDTAVCSSCTDIEHGRHSTIRVMDAVAEEKLRLQDLLSGIQTKVEKIEKAIESTDGAVDGLNTRKEKGLFEINAAFNQLLHRLEERRQNLIEDLQVQYNHKLEAIQNSKSALKGHLKGVQECCLLTERALSHNENETEILFLKKQIGERLEDYAKMEVNLAQLDDSLEFDHLTIDRVDTGALGRVVSSLHKGWAVSGDVFESRCVPIGRRQFLRLHLLTNYFHNYQNGDDGEESLLDSIHVPASTKDVVYSLEQPRESDNRSFIIRFIVSRIGSFTLSVCIKSQHISGSPFQFHAYDGSEDRSATSSPGPFIRASSASTTHSPTSFGGCGGSLSRIPRGNNHGGASPRSRMSTPTKKFTSSNGHSISNGLHHHQHHYHSRQSSHSHHGSSASCAGGGGSGGGGGGGSSRRSTVLEDDLILKIGQRGRNRGEFTNPQGVIATTNGRVIVTDSNNQCVQIFDTTGEIKLKFGVSGRTVGQLQRPVGVAILPSTGNIAVADYDNKWISIFDSTGKFMSRIGHGKLLGPKGLTVDANGLIYVVDNKASCILIFQPNGKLINKFGSRGNDEGQFAGPHFIAVNSKGNIIVTDFHNHCVKVFDSDGDYLYSFGTNGEGSGQFNAPTGVAVDKYDNILVADWGNSRIQVFDCQGTFQSYINTQAEPLYGPQGLTVTPDGYVAIADSGNHCVKLYKYSPVIPQN